MAKVKVETVTIRVTAKARERLHKMADKRKVSIISLVDQLVGL